MSFRSDVPFLHYHLVHLKGESSLIGKFIDVKITASNTWALYGEIV